jgi:hypothetical protein
MARKDRKHYVGSHGRRLSHDEALELGRRLFDAINADRLLRSVEPDTTEGDDQDGRPAGGDPDAPDPPARS